jgi:hypothetical protein
MSSTVLSWNKLKGLLHDSDSARCEYISVNHRSSSKIYAMLLEVIIPTFGQVRLQWSSLLNTHVAFLVIGFMLSELRRALDRGRHNEQHNKDLPPLIGWRIPCMCLLTASAIIY